jgi:predicted RNA-binding Zn ribbon-like protein
MMVETRAVEPTAATTRLDGGHPALELVNTIWGQVGGPVEHDVLATPEDLVTLARRLGFIAPTTPAAHSALDEARALRGTLDAVLRACIERREPPPAPLAALTRHIRAAIDAARLVPAGQVLQWSWDPSDAHTPVHRFAYAALELLTDEAELARLHQCQACCWLFVDHSRGAGRRWCSMAYCGGDAKKRRYVERRRERRRQLNPDRRDP